MSTALEDLDDYYDYDEIPDEPDPELIELIKDRFGNEGFSYRLQADAKARLKNDPWVAMQFEPVNDPVGDESSVGDPVSPPVAMPAARRCKWEGCKEAARVRKGPRGPHPRWCEPHTRQRKLDQDNGKSQKRQYRPCCQDWQADADPEHTGKCPQCDQWLKFAKSMRWAVAPSAVRVISAELGAGGWHIEKF